MLVHLGPQSWIVLALREVLSGLHKNTPYVAKVSPLYKSGRVYILAK